MKSSPARSLLLDSVDSMKTLVSPLNQWNLGAPIVEGSGDEDLLASFRPADHSGPGLLCGLYGVVQVLLP